LKLENGSAGAPSIALLGNGGYTTGMYASNGPSLNFTLDGTEAVSFYNNSVLLKSTGAYLWSPTTNISDPRDTSLSRYAAGVLAIGNGTAGDASGGLVAFASSTIGSGSQGGGLTISGGATTTGNAYFAGMWGLGRRRQPASSRSTLQWGVTTPSYYVTLPIPPPRGSILPHRSVRLPTSISTPAASSFRVNTSRSPILNPSAAVSFLVPTLARL
jgi:hypothetical protein